MINPCARRNGSRHTACVVVELRPLQSSELLAAWELLTRAFGHPLRPEDIEVELALVDPSRFYAAWEDGRAVATGGSFALDMALPGSVAPVAGVTWVAVLPTARRRGVLTSVMQRQLGDLHDEGTAVAALWASEGAIYGRFGYGPASWTVSVRLPRRAALRTTERPGAIRLVEPAAEQLTEVYDEVAARSPGFPARNARWWAYRLHDPEHARAGRSALQCVVTDGGYALYAVEASWSDAVPEGVVHVRELVAVDEDARVRLWRYLLDVDLTAQVRVGSLAPDDPLLLRHLAEPRTARAQVRDGLWVRLVDVPQALALRRYASDVDVVLDVVDPRCPWNEGRWHLSGGRDGATCTTTGAAADLVVAVDDLGAAFLGGTPLRSRGVEERTPGALERTSTAFSAVGTGPWCPHVF